jgi:N-acetylglucosaminyl-diphospho-decaprenol L-rhamnosyltransferase
MSVAVVIVNYKTAESTIEGVAALLPSLKGLADAQVIVVDNLSGDGSLERLREAFSRPTSTPVSVVDAGHNGGYGLGINVGIRHALTSPRPPRYIFIINPDAVAEPGSLATLLACMDDHPEVGLAGSLIRGPGGDVQGQAFRFPSVWSELESTARLGPISGLLARHIVALRPNVTTEVDWVPGTSMLVRTEVFTRGGWFDPGFFLYFEEIDFARRVKNAGWKVLYVEGAPITHIGSLSTGMADETRRMPRYWFESRRRYLVKHHGVVYAVACDAAWLAGHSIYQVKSRLVSKDPPTRPRIGRDFLKFGLEQALRAAPHAPQNAHLATSAPARDDEPWGPDEKGNTKMTAGPDAADAPSTASLVVEDFATHNRDLTAPGFWAVATHRIGKHALDESRPRAERVVSDVVYRAMFRGVDLLWGIHLPRSVALGRRVRIWHNGCMLLTAKSIGNDVTLRHDTTFGPLRAGRQVSAETPAGAALDLPVIEDGVDIGSGACVLGGVRVGRRAVIGANSVVLKDVPADATVLGVPARIVPM